ncbi:unnamed protein product [Lupinus luteus]|uniref:Uncharacterized protein n=1 Tax=Lupinus luteus TaxID=3873 RepID=A0AAV1WBC0_LUPLU
MTIYDGFQFAAKWIEKLIGFTVVKVLLAVNDSWPWRDCSEQRPEAEGTQKDSGMTTTGECRYRRAIRVGLGGRLDVVPNWPCRSFLPRR